MGKSPRTVGFMRLANHPAPSRIRGFMRVLLLLIYGSFAGFLRNDEMLRSATHAVGFWNGRSRGTADMIVKVRARGLPLRVIRI